LSSIISQLRSLSFKEKIGQLFMIGFYGHELPSQVQAFIEENNIGFVILFSRNIKSIPQVIELTNTIHSLGKTHPLVYTDQEGGTIVRFNEMAATVVSAMGIAATGSMENAEIAGQLIGKDMRLCGIDGVFAPVLDVNVEENNPVIGIRSFSDQPEIVIEYASHFCRGLAKSGTLACGKHFPGHGAATVDSHLGIPIISISKEYFMRCCFQPFEALAKQKIDSLMTSHVLFSGISPDISTFSSYMIQELLRKHAGYDGVVFTDCLEMKAVKDNYSAEGIVVKAMDAGIDVMVPSHTLDFQKELLEIIMFHVKKDLIPEKRIDESVSRILALKNKLKDQKPPERPKGQFQLRKSIAMEQKIADQSVTLLRNRTGILPIEKNKKILVLEWARMIRGPSIAEQEKQSVIGEISGIYLSDRDLNILKPDEPLPLSLIQRFNDYTYIIACIYSRTGELDQFQTEAVKKLLRLRKDAVIVSLEAPYEIIKFPLVDTFLVTFGFRKVQVEALFKVLTGTIKPTGRLPVEIKNIFPYGFGLDF
jgi:beta-N-acetylhexosaminidase